MKKFYITYNDGNKATAEFHPNIVKYLENRQWVAGTQNGKEIAFNLSDVSSISEA